MKLFYFFILFFMPANVLPNSFFVNTDGAHAITPTQNLPPTKLFPKFLIPLKQPRYPVSLSSISSLPKPDTSTVDKGSGFCFE